MLNPGVWFLLFGNEVPSPSVIYELLVPFFAEISEEVTEMKTVLRKEATINKTPLPIHNGPDEAQSQPR